MRAVGARSGTLARRARLPRWVLCCALCGCAPSENADVVSVDWRSAEVARVGKQPIARELVEQVAVRQALSPKDALERLIRTWLVGQALERREPDLAHYLERTVLARRLEEDWAEQARRAGPPTAHEVAALTESHWWELDRPRAVRTIHAVIEAADGQARDSARAAAAELRKAVLGADSAEQFRERAEAFTSDGHEVRVEALEPVTEDGRVVLHRPLPPGVRQPRYDGAFARAANALAAEGEVSDVVETRFGYHVIFSTEVLPERRVELAERRELLRSEIMAHRAGELQRQALRAARDAVSVEISSDALSLMERVSVEQ